MLFTTTTTGSNSPAAATVQAQDVEMRDSGGGGNCVTMDQDNCNIFEMRDNGRGGSSVAMDHEANCNMETQSSPKERPSTMSPYRNDSPRDTSAPLSDTIPDAAFQTSTFAVSSSSAGQPQCLVSHWDCWERGVSAISNANHETTMPAQPYRWAGDCIRALLE